MFNPKEYWKRRKAGLRGQEVAELKLIPKGVKVEYTTREGKKAEYPNGQGQHMVFGRGMVNRKQSREKLPKFKDTTAGTRRSEAKAAKHAKRNAGEHERALKEKAGK